MDRRSFIRRALGAAAVLALPLPKDASAEVEIEETTASLPLTAFVNGWGNAGNGTLISTRGLCAPVAPYYDIEWIHVKDLLPSFQANRGGITYKRQA